MDPLIEKVLTAGGSLGVLVAVVYLFLQQQRVTAREHRAWMDQLLAGNRAWLEKMHSDHLDARRESRDALNRNTSAMDQNTRALYEVTEFIRRTSKA